MTHEEHRRRHVKLHQALDELFADFIQHHPGDHHFTQMPLIDLLKWSNQQTIDPAELPVPEDRTPKS